MKNKFLISFLGCFLLLASTVFALAPCAETTSTTSTAFTNVTPGVNEAIAYGADSKFGSFTNITPTETFKLTDYCENVTLVNGTSVVLNWLDLDVDESYIVNATNVDQYLGVGNYTFNYTLGTVAWINDSWEDELVSVCYNKTFTAVSTDLVSLARGYTENSPGYGVTKTWTVLADYGIENYNWTAFYTEVDRTCSARDSCEATKFTIFAGFALMAVAIIILSAFALIKITSGGDGSLMMVTIGAIGLAIILMVGYVIVSQVAQSICQAAVG